MSTTDLVIAPGATWADLHQDLHRILLRDPASAVVVATSGSTGTPKRVRMPGSALRASGEATAQVLDGPGHWLLALPTQHVAGLQVLARSVLAGTVPVPLPTGMSFTPQLFAAAVARMAEDGPRYASLVPTQLHRLLVSEGADGGGEVERHRDEGVQAAASLDAVLLGGAAADPGLLARAARAGIRVVTTYGMSETCGGCVYDGRPLPGLRVRLDPTGRVHLAGPMLADGYVDPDGSPDPDRTGSRFVTDDDGTRWFRTDDRGELTDGLLRIRGRVDDVIITGGHKVEPREVEQALRALPEVVDALVLALPDHEWGQVVAALVVPRARTGAPRDRAEPLPDLLRERLRPALPAHAVPRRVEVVDAIPLLDSGKPDPTRARQLLDRPRRSH